MYDTKKDKKRKVLKKKLISKKVCNINIMFVNVWIHLFRILHYFFKLCHFSFLNGVGISCNFLLFFFLDVLTMCHTDLQIVTKHCERLKLTAGCESLSLCNSTHWTHTCCPIYWNHPTDYAHLKLIFYQDV